MSETPIGNPYMGIDTPSDEIYNINTNQSGPPMSARHKLQPRLLRSNPKLNPIHSLRNLGKNIGQQYCWCSLMSLMPLKSLSNCDYELNFYLRLILGPIHSNQVMGTDPVGSHHGTRNSQSNSINPTYPYQSHD